MPSLCRRINYGNIELHQDTNGQTVGVLLRDGECRYKRWLGFINEAEARLLPDARSVLLEIQRYNNSDHLMPTWIDVPSGHFVQGCLTSAGVYAVTQGQIQVKLVTK